jgi:hypothetical protein
MVLPPASARMSSIDLRIPQMIDGFPQIDADLPVQSGRRLRSFHFLFSQFHLPGNVGIVVALIPAAVAETAGRIRILDFFRLLFHYLFRLFLFFHRPLDWPFNRFLLSINWPFWLFQLDNGPFGLLL